MSAGLLLLAVLAAGAQAASPAQGLKGAFKGKSVVLVSIDTLRADHLGAYGYTRPTSPHFDALARESLVYERAYSQAPYTAPSHMTLFTGVLPAVHGVVNWHSRTLRRVSERLPTLASLLAKAGYTTAAYSGGGNLHPEFGFDQGFDSFVMTRWQDIGAAGHALLETARRGGRFFFFAHTYQVHAPYVPPAPYARLFVDPAYGGRILSSKEELVRQVGSDVWERLQKPFWEPVDSSSPADVSHLLNLYDAGIRKMDDDLALFLRRFREAGLDRDANLVVTSDHGEEFMEHGGLQHGSRLYDEQLHVPLLVRLPSAAGAGRRGEVVRLLDVVPTLLELLGLPAPEHLQGQPLPGLSAGSERRPVYAEEQNEGLQSLRIGDTKYLRHGDREELFDLASDPGERSNQLTQDQAYVWRGRVSRILEASLTLGAGFRSSEVPALDPETKRQLEALGYVAGGR